ncbi:hypothetical protein [Aureimonas frigidaquae]|uniref:hypothetical protein n=1 Tax=Aureimonas frigidaquae TaxID=424757 RepID=UPI000A7E71FF|nr:hypothetical protein [Aureimonas frigidaquae]
MSNRLSDGVAYARKIADGLEAGLRGRHDPLSAEEMVELHHAIANLAAGLAGLERRLKRDLDGQEPEGRAPNN